MSASNDPASTPAAAKQSSPLVKEVPNPADFSIVRTKEYEKPEQCVVGRTQQQLDREIELLAAEVARIDNNLSKVIVGMRQERRLMIVSPIVRGHILLEGAPGMAKTLLCQTFAESLGLHYQRIQFTPDLTANDIIGFQRPNNRGEFEFQPGPIFGNVVLADEINRAPGKTQAALLQAMQEGEITVDRKTYVLPKPFLVMATQNPLELSSATYPLPDAQLDRIGVKVVVSYPNENDHLEIAIRGTSANSTRAEQIFSRGQADDLFKRAFELVRGVQIEPQILKNVVKLIRSLNPLPNENSQLSEVQNKTIVQGPSPRGTNTLLRYAQGVALLDGRSYVVADDIHEIAIPVLRHRVQLSDMALEKNISVDDILRKALHQFFGAPKRPVRG